MFCSPFLTHGRELKLLSLIDLAQVFSLGSPGVGRHLQVVLLTDQGVRLRNDPLM